MELELWSEGELKAMVRPTPHGLEVQVFAHDRDLRIPVPWLMEKLAEAQRDLVSEGEENRKE